jgi:hypothetical protein
MLHSYLLCIPMMSSSSLFFLLFLTNSRQQSSSCDVNTFSNSQNFFTFYAPLNVTAMITTLILE